MENENISDKIDIKVRGTYFKRWELNSLPTDFLQKAIPKLALLSYNLGIKLSPSETKLLTTVQTTVDVYDPRKKRRNYYAPRCDRDISCQNWKKCKTLFEFNTRRGFFVPCAEKRVYKVTIARTHIEENPFLGTVNAEFDLRAFLRIAYAEKYHTSICAVSSDWNLTFDTFLKAIQLFRDPIKIKYTTPRKKRRVGDGLCFESEIESIDKLDYDELYKFLLSRKIPIFSKPYGYLAIYPTFMDIFCAIVDGDYSIRHVWAELNTVLNFNAFASYDSNENPYLTSYFLANEEPKHYAPYEKQEKIKEIEKEIIDSKRFVAYEINKRLKEKRNLKGIETKIFGDNLLEHKNEPAQLSNSDDKNGQ